MKNRILWIFEEAEAAQNSPSEVEQINSDEENSTFVALPWAMFGAIGAQQRAEIQRNYRLAYERTKAQQEQRHEEAERFERLLVDLEVPNWVEEA